MMGNNMALVDELDAYKQGFADGKQFVLDMISESTQHKFVDVAQLIIWIRQQQESQNEIK